MSLDPYDPTPCRQVAPKKVLVVAGDSWSLLSTVSVLSGDAGAAVATICNDEVSPPVDIPMKGDGMKKPTVTQQIVEAIFGMAGEYTQAVLLAVRPEVTSYVSFILRDLVKANFIIRKVAAQKEVPGYHGRGVLLTNPAYVYKNSDLWRLSSYPIAVAMAAVKKQASLRYHDKAAEKREKKERAEARKLSRQNKLHQALETATNRENLLGRLERASEEKKILDQLEALEQSNARRSARLLGR